MRRLKYCLIQLLVVLFTYSASAQIYNEGTESCKVRYEVLKAPSYRLIFPMEYRKEALSLSNFVDTIAPYVAYGIRNRYYSFPIILYTSEQYSNGMVSLVPSRVELFATPSVSMTSTPWMKQLLLHEYRHVAQISALRTGFTKGAYYPLGEIGWAIGLAVTPKWILEGDATNAETQLTEFGRGLQPSFTIEYRAMMTDEAKKPFSKYKIDNLIIGSYQNHVPDIYKFGYQMVRSYETNISPTFAGDFYHYAGRHPFVISPIFFYTHRNGFRSVRHFAKYTFAKLDSLWRPLSSCDNNYNYVTRSERSYTTYQYPISLADGKFLAVKKSMDTPSTFVITDGSKEVKIGKPGNISSRPVLKDSIVYWTEYKSDVFYELKSSSVIRSINMFNKFHHSYREDVNSYLLTPTGNQGWASVRYDSLLHAHVYIHDNEFVDIDSISFEKRTSVHGMAYDEMTSKLYFIAVDDDGMWIGASSLSSAGPIDVIRRPSAVTLSDLTASDGKLYFGSIQSGKDEIHMIDLNSKEEYQITKSKLGARQPFPISSDSIAFTGYSVKGWNIASMSNSPEDSLQIGWQRLPENILNPPYVKWYDGKTFDTINIDSVRIQPNKSVKRYRRASNWFNFHSWIPVVAADVDEVLDDFNSSIGLGATGMFQSALGDFEGYVSVGTKENYFWTLGKMNFNTLPVKFSIKGEYGGGTQRVYCPKEKYHEITELVDVGKYYRVVSSISLPMNFSSYSVSRKLTPSINYIRTGDIIYDDLRDTCLTGLNRYEASISYSTYQSYSTRSLLPRLGFSCKFGVQGVFHKDFSKIIYSKLNGYLPGFMKNHTLSLYASVQYQYMSKYGLFAKTNVPTGIIDENIYQKYHFFAAYYDFPICYPDWGLDRYVFFKRFTGEVFGEYSMGSYNNEYDLPSVYNYSCGFSLGVDISLLTSFTQSLKVKVAFPKSLKPYVGFAYSFNIN